MKWLILRLGAFLSLVMFGISVSGGIPIKLEHSAEVAQTITSARQRILILVPSLRSRAVADALRKLIVEGGVHLQILCDASLMAERSNFIPMISLLRNRKQNVEVRVLRGVNRVVLIVDESRAVFGPLVAEPESISLKITRLINDATEAKLQVRAFEVQWKRATPWRYQIQAPIFSNGGQK